MARSVQGWEVEIPCLECGAKSALLVAGPKIATYECRGTPVEPHSAYGPDRCGAIFRVNREYKEP